MARDPCVLSNQPTAIAPARPTIAHVQLRDLLVCPRESGVVNYIVEGGIAEQDVRSPRRPIRILTRTTFTANSLTSFNVGDDTLFAAGGQDKEIHLSYHTPATTPRIRSRTRLVWDFEDHLSGSINNSILLTAAHQSSVEPRVAISNNDGSIKMYDVPIRIQSSRRKLALIGEVRLDVPINHSSISPDGRTLLSVGDSSKVYLHQISGGSSRLSFTPIHTLLIPPPSPSSSNSSSHSLFSSFGYGNSSYSNSLAASFSTAFSGDGSKFAVASQEGVVAVWDVRWTGRPMKAWYTDKSRGGVGGGIPNVGGGIYSAGNGGGGHMNGGASGWLTNNSSYALLSPSLSAASSTSGSPNGYNNSSAYLSDDPWEWAKGTKAPGWCVRSVKFNGGEGARMGREVMAFTEHTSLIHIVDARTFETHDVIRVPTLFNSPSSSSSSASAYASVLRGKRRSNKGVGRDGNIGVGGDLRRRRRLVASGMGVSRTEGGGVELPVSHARSIPSTHTSIPSGNGGTSGGAVDVDPQASGASSSAVGVNVNASGSRSRSRPRVGRQTSARIGNTGTIPSRRNTPNQQPGAGTGISVVQALGDAFRIAFPSGSGSGSGSGSSGFSFGAGNTATTSSGSIQGTATPTITTPRYSPPASIGDSTWRTLGRPGGLNSAGLVASSTTGSVSTTQTPPASTPTSTEPFLVSLTVPRPDSSSAVVHPTVNVIASERGERRRRGNVRLPGTSAATGNVIGSPPNTNANHNAMPHPGTVGESLREWARIAIEEIGNGRVRSRTGDNLEQEDEDYHRGERDDARRRVRMRMMREEEEEEEEEETEEEHRQGGTQEEEGIVVVPDLGDRDVESEVHALLAVHGISSRLGGIHHGRRDYEVDEQTNEDTEEEEESGMDVDVQELHNDGEERRFNEYTLHEREEEDEDEEMYDDEELYDDDAPEHGYHDEDEDEDDIDIFDVECLSASGSRNASPGPSQRRIRQGTSAEDAATGAYDTFIGGRNAVRQAMAGGASTSMRYGSTPPTSSAGHTPHHHTQLRGGKSSGKEGSGPLTHGGRRLGYHDDLDLAGLCFDPCGERMYVLNLLPSPFGGVGAGDVHWGMGSGSGSGDGGAGGAMAGAVVEWSVRGAEKRWWVDESWM